MQGAIFFQQIEMFSTEYILDEYPSTISILPYTWNNDVFRDKKISDALKSQIKSFYC